MKPMEHGVELESMYELGVVIEAFDDVLKRVEGDTEHADTHDLFWQLRQHLAMRYKADGGEEVADNFSFKLQGYAGECALAALRSTIDPELTPRALAMYQDYSLQMMERDMQNPSADQ